MTCPRKNKDCRKKYTRVTVCVNHTTVPDEDEQRRLWHQALFHQMMMEAGTPDILVNVDETHHSDSISPRKNSNICTGGYTM